MNILRDSTLNQAQNDPTWLIMVERFGRGLFSLAIIGIGIETLICSYVSSQSSGPHYKVIPVIPWVPPTPIPSYLLGVIFSLCGASLLLQRKVVLSCVTVGVVMLICGLAFDVPRHPDLMSAPWRTNVLEPIAIGCLAWLAPGAPGIPRWLHRTSRYLLAFALIVFGTAHFQVLTFIASMVPRWIPWHQFWTAVFGVAFIAAGVSFATGYLQRWAALALGLMFALWAVVIHLPALVAKQVPDNWSDMFIVAAFWGGFWMITRNLRDTLRPSLQRSRSN